MPLTNHTDGGEGAHGFQHSEEFKASRRKPFHLTFRHKLLKFPSRKEAYENRSKVMKEKYKDNPPFVYDEELNKRARKLSVEKTSKRVLE